MSEQITRVAVVTGGSRGIGRAICTALAEKGCCVVVNCRHGVQAAEETAALCREKGFHTETGEFGAYMQVDSCNHGPFTLVVDTDSL